MKSKHTHPLQRSRDPRPDWTPGGLGLAPGRYEAVLSYLFDRPVPQGEEQEWYWDDDLEDFDATSLEWTRFQTAIFANAATDLARFTDEQVGMGLNYLMSNHVSNVPYAAMDPAVPLVEAMRMMQAMPLLWRGCIGPRLAHDRSPVGGITGRLGCACHMWFDVWPTQRGAGQGRVWTEAVCVVLQQMLTMPFRAVQIAALHGIGHLGGDSRERQDMKAAVAACVRSLPAHEEELRTYAESAMAGTVLYCVAVTDARAETAIDCLRFCWGRTAGRDDGRHVGSCARRAEPARVGCEIAGRVHALPPDRVVHGHSSATLAALAGSTSGRPCLMAT